MRVLDIPLEEVVVDVNPHKKVLCFSKGEGHTSSFGYEWNKYSRTYSDTHLGVPVSKGYLEMLMGFPVEFLKGMNVLELGCGAGRFTTILADYAKHVVAVDLSRAVYVNAALGRSNVTVLQADLLTIPKLSEPIDLVFCRGVIQHTKDPRTSMKRLFDYCKHDSIVIFNFIVRMETINGGRFILRATRRDRSYL